MSLSLRVLTFELITEGTSLYLRCLWNYRVFFKHVLLALFLPVPRPHVFTHYHHHLSMATDQDYILICSAVSTFLSAMLGVKEFNQEWKSGRAPGFVDVRFLLNSS